MNRRKQWLKPFLGTRPRNLPSWLICNLCFFKRFRLTSHAREQSHFTSVDFACLASSSSIAILPGYIQASGVVHLRQYQIQPVFRFHRLVPLSRVSDTCPCPHCGSGSSRLEANARRSARADHQRTLCLWGPPESSATVSLA